jgi:hypothetical protein
LLERSEIWNSTPTTAEVAPALAKMLDSQKSSWLYQLDRMRDQFNECVIKLQIEKTQDGALSTPFSPESVILSTTLRDWPRFFQISRVSRALPRL